MVTKKNSSGWEKTCLPLALESHRPLVGDVCGGKTHVPPTDSHTRPSVEGKIKTLLSLCNGCKLVARVERCKKTRHTKMQVAGTLSLTSFPCLNVVTIYVPSQRLLNGYSFIREVDISNLGELFKFFDRILPQGWECYIEKHRSLIESEQNLILQTILLNLPKSCAKFNFEIPISLDDPTVRYEYIFDRARGDFVSPRITDASIFEGDFFSGIKTIRMSRQRNSEADIAHTKLLIQNSRLKLTREEVRLGASVTIFHVSL